MEHLFSPIKLRGLELKNRVLMPGMDTKPAHDGIGSELGIFCRVIGDARSIGNALDATSAGVGAIYEPLEANE